MVCLITGVPGSGKSLALVKRFIIPALKKGRRVYTNVDGMVSEPPSPVLLNLSLASGVSPEEVEKLLFGIPDGSPNKLLNEMPLGALAVIDEAQIYWNARDYSTDKNKSVLPYFQKHRHYGHDVILATQHFEQLDSGIRRLAEVHYRLKRLKNLGLGKVIKVSVFSQGLSIDCEPVASEAWSIDKSVFGCYKSYESGKIAEAKYRSHNVFLRSPVMWLCLLIFVWFAWALATGKVSALVRMDFFGKNAAEAPAEASPEIQRREFFKNIYGGEKQWADYWCHRKLYVRVIDSIGAEARADTLEARGVPPAVCPRFGWLYSRQEVLK